MSAQHAVIERLVSIERELKSLFHDAMTCAPALDDLTEDDWDHVALRVANIMTNAVEYLDEAGFGIPYSLDDAFKAGEAIKVELTQLIVRRAQECPGCGAVPGESDECTGQIDCEAPQ